MTVELKEQIKILLALQDLDTHIAVIRQEQEEAPQRVAELERRLDDRRAALSQGQATQGELEARRSDLERRIEEGERKTKRSQAKINEIRNARQHKAIMKELEDLKMLKEDWESELLEVMEALEEANAQVEEAGVEVQRLSEAFDKERSELEAKKASMVDDLARLTKERKSHVEAVPGPMLAQYDFIRSRINDTAVAPVIGGTCQICHMSLPPQQFIELQRRERLMTCPNCQRIIYWAEAEDD